MRVYFIRHGESEENVRTGHYMEDPSLTPKGRRQIEAAGYRLLQLLSGKSVDVLASSTYTRARQSIEILSGIVPSERKEILFSDALRERRHPSAILGLRNHGEEVTKIFKDLYGDHHDRYRYGDEETFWDFHHRVKKEIIETFLEGLRREGKKVVIVMSHATTIRCVAASMSLGDTLHYDNFSEIMMNTGLKNGSITTCEYKRGWNGNESWHAVTINDQSHLENIK